MSSQLGRAHDAAMVGCHDKATPVQAVRIQALAAHERRDVGLIPFRCGTNADWYDVHALSRLTMVWG